MNTTLSWIKAYVPDLDCTAKEYANAMTMSGTKVETYTEYDRDLDRIVVGQIMSIEPHPDADHLVICQVDIGTETIQIVTGAPNVAVGQKVPVVLDGGKVAGNHDGKMTQGGIPIKAGKLRGVESNGMMCSIEELGSSREFYPEAPEYGIYVFDNDVPAGADAVHELGLDDTNVEYEITNNRVDCYSVIGIAREAAATFHKEFHKPEVPKTGNEEDVNDYVKVRVEDPDLCPRYTARVVKNIHIAPSPKWMQRRLAANGIRPINNLVDITNYVMEEYGQPMHAYDYDKIAGHEIIVKRAQDGEVYTTLDGQERHLDKDVLMINDAEGPVGIAGIMGGENSMITDDVKTMLFEAACFNGTNIRLSAKRIGLQTDASRKFDKGLDPNLAAEAINRACALVEEMGAGEVVGGMIDIYPVKREESRVAFEPDKINQLLGTDIPAEQMLKYFAKIELRYDKDTNEIAAPTFRQDIHRTCDLAEEVARFYGYDRIPTTLPKGEATQGGKPEELMVQEMCSTAARYCGFSEAFCYSFESPKVYDKLRIPEGDPIRNAITISNPLGEDFSIMRTIPLNGMLTSLAFNQNHRNKNVRLYEFGKIYLPKALPLTELPDERQQLTLGAYGDYDFFQMKGTVEVLLDALHIKEKPVYDPAEKKPFLHTGRQADIFIGKTKIGYLGELHPLVLQNYGITERTYVAVLDMPSVCCFADFDRKFEGIARFPAVERDLSMVVPKHISNGQIEAMLEQRGGKILENVELFDLYEGIQVKPGFKSMAYRLTFRAKDRTLQDADIDAAMKKVLNGLKSMEIELRS